MANLLDCDIVSKFELQLRYLDLYLKQKYQLTYPPSYRLNNPTTILL